MFVSVRAGDGTRKTGNKINVVVLQIRVMPKVILELKVRHAGKLHESLCVFDKSYFLPL